MIRISGRVLAVIGVAIAVCAPPPAQASRAQLTYVGGSEFPARFQFQGTTVGGLSGISYDPGRQLYYVISDDKSDHNPARFYTMRIPMIANQIGGVEFVDTHSWQNTPGHPDPEDIAFDRRRQQLYWSSERNDAWIRIAGFDGSYRGEFVLPSVLDPRDNAGLEGLTVTPSAQFVWAAMEEPGYNDGEPPTTRTGALTRITKFDVTGRTAVAQFAYPLDPIPAPDDSATGLSALVALDEDTFLTVERSHGTFNVARIYRAGVDGADDVLGLRSLRGASLVPMAKTLVADLTTVPGVPPLDNLEGITLGPPLADGRQSVVLVSDNNFNPQQVTQIVVFAMCGVSSLGFTLAALTHPLRYDG